MSRGPPSPLLLPSLPPSPPSCSEPPSPALLSAAKRCDALTLEADKDFWARHEELRPLGRGCFGTVLLVRERETLTEALLAAKVVVTDDAADALNEAALLHGLLHPNIVRLHSVYASVSTVFVLMNAELGGDLSTRAAAQPNGCLTESDARAPLAGVLAALHHLHERHGIVHRDVKASNVLLASDGATAKLGDFGLAKQLPESGRLTSVCGTHDFLAPEMIRTGHGEADGYGASVDLWAVGLMLHGLLFGANPFERDTDIATLQAILAGEYAPPTDADATSSSASLRSLLSALLVTEPADRAAAKDALDSAWLCGAAPALRSPPASPSRPGHRRSRSGRLIERLFARAA